MKSMAAKIDVFRTNVRREAARIGISHYAIADKAGICHTYLSRIINGKSDPTIGVCERIAAALETSLEAMLAEPASMAKPNPAPLPLVVRRTCNHKITNSANSVR